MSDRLQEIKERVNAATEGPWLHPDDSCRDEWYGDFWEVHVRGGEDTCVLAMNGADSEFIAHAREDVPWLLGELARVTDALREIESKPYRAEEVIARLRGSVPQEKA